MGAAQDKQNVAAKQNPQAKPSANVPQVTTQVQPALVNLAQKQELVLQPPSGPGGGSQRSMHDDEEGEQDMEGTIGGASQRNTFIGNTVRDVKPDERRSVNPLQKSDVMNRFKDSVDQLPLSQKAPSQAQVQSVIESYQQQMKDFKQTVNDFDSKLGSGPKGPIPNITGTLSNPYTMQEEDDRNQTFRTEMMMSGGTQPRFQRPPPSIYVSQPGYASIVSQNPVASQYSKTPTGFLQASQQQQDPRNSIQTQNMKGADQNYVMQQSMMQESQRSAVSNGAPYTSTFPDFRQDSRPSFNVEFKQDQKPITKYQQPMYQQEPYSSEGFSAQNYAQQVTPQTQYEIRNSGGASLGAQANFRQDSKPFMQQLPSEQRAPSEYPPSMKQPSEYPPSMRQPSEYPSSQRQQSVQQQQIIQQQSSMLQPVSSVYSQRQQEQQSLSDTQKFRDSNLPFSDTKLSVQQQSQRPYQQSYQQQDPSLDSYSLPPKKESVLLRPMVPRDQLLTSDQKAMLQLGQKDESMQRKLDQPLLTQLMMNNGGDDEDELNGYYNFDVGYKKPENLGIGRNFTKAPPPEQRSQVLTSVVRGTGERSSEVEGASILTPMEQSLRQAAESEGGQYVQQQEPELTMDGLAYLKEQFLEQEERERLNPQNVLIRVLFIHAFNSDTDSEQAAFLESTTDRRLYSFFVRRASKVLDLKEQIIKQEFGFHADQLKLYFKYREAKDAQPLLEIEQYDIEEDILICVTINGPKTHIPAILREPLDDIKIADVRLINSREKTDKGDVSQNFELDRFDVDQDKLPWPVYRDWTAEAAYLSNIIIRNKTALLSEEQQFQMQQGITKQLHQNPDLAELTEAEAAYFRLCEDFRKASLYTVHLIVKKNPTPLNLFNLYGDDGDKYVAGGILVRRAKDWTVCGQPFTEQSRMQTTQIGSGGDSGPSISEISGKIAMLDVRNLAALRNRVSRLVVPMACLVDYFGLKFECQSLAPLSMNSLVYGSDTNGLVFTNRDEHAEAMARQLSSLLNIKPHYVEEQATLKMKLAYLPYSVQLHRNKDLQDDINLYLVNPFRLFAQDESLRQAQQTVPIQEIMSKQLRPEFLTKNNKGEPDPECQYFTWRRPTKCDECGEWINDYEYYYFEKKSVDKSQRLLAAYYCCIGCFMERLPTENFKFPVNKMKKKELQQKDRLQFYQNMTTGRRYMDMQFSRVPLNPDAYFHLSNGKDKADKISEQEEILRAAQKLKDEVLGKLVEDLNNVEEDPMSGEALEVLLHSRGINVRNLGRLCTIAELNHIRELCVIEVIARSAKLLIKDGLTFLADDEEAGFQADNIKKCVLHYLLEIFKTDDGQQSAVQSIWDFITEHSRKKFQVTVEKDILTKVNMHGLLLSILAKLNIRLRKPVRDIDFYSVSAETGERNFLVLDDIESIAPIVKDYHDKQPVLTCKEEVFPSSLNLVIECARMKDAQGRRTQWFMRGGEERSEATELFRLTASVCEQVLGNRSIRYARVLKEFAEHLESRHQEKGRPENSRWNKSFAIAEEELSSEARFFFNTALQTLKDIRQEMTVEAAEINVALARLVKPRNAQFSHYREQDSGPYDVFQYLMQAIDVYEVVLGYDHPETADTYTKMALAYQESGNFAAASPWIRRAFSVFYKCFGPHDAITQSAYEQLKGIETNVDSKLDQVPFEDLPLVIFEIEKQQKLLADQQMQLAMLNNGRSLTIGQQY